MSKMETGMKRLHVTMGTGIMTTFSCVPKLLSVDSLRMQFSVVKFWSWS